MKFKNTTSINYSENMSSPNPTPTPTPISYSIPDSISESSPINECAICFETIGQSNCCVTQCNHAFCFKCMLDSLNYSNTCPLCRTTLREEEEEEDDEDDEEDDEDDEEEQEGDDNDEMNEDTTASDLTKRLIAGGYTMEDLVILITGRIKFNNVENRKKFNKLDERFDHLITEIDNERENTELFAQEDTRTQEDSISRCSVEDRETFDTLWAKYNLFEGKVLVDIKKLLPEYNSDL